MGIYHFGKKIFLSLFMMLCMWFRISVKITVYNLYRNENTWRILRSTYSQKASTLNGRELPKGLSDLHTGTPVLLTVPETRYSRVQHRQSDVHVDQLLVEMPLASIASRSVTIAKTSQWCRHWDNSLLELVEPLGTTIT